MMEIVYFANFINHHQKPFSDELYKMPNVHYTFIEVEPMYNWLKQGGYSEFSNLPYVIRAWESEANKNKAKELAVRADVALFAGHEVIEYAVIRSKLTNKLSFEVGERWLKRGLLNLLSPRLLKFQWFYHTIFFKKPYYRLCASAYAAGDEYFMHSFVERCYKWGYFTKINNLDIVSKGIPNNNISIARPLRIMWCARFLKWKHPELPILMSKRLKEKGYMFVLDMYGSGKYLQNTCSLAKKLAVDDVVNFCGNAHNDEILSAMYEHDVFLFTSDQNEGWGAVINEAMSNFCVVVGSNKVGSVPFLIKDKINGLQFLGPTKRSGFFGKYLKIDKQSLDSLTCQVEFIFNHPGKLDELSKAAYHTICNNWSPRNAAQNFLLLIEDLQNGKECSIIEGPCSKALPY